MVTCCCSAKWHAGSSDRPRILWSWSNKDGFTRVEFLPERMPPGGKEVFCGTECEDRGSETDYCAPAAGLLLLFQNFLCHLVLVGFQKTDAGENITSHHV